MAEAGWYPDPYDESRIRYFDGAQWTDHHRDRSSVGNGQSGEAGEQAPPFVPVPGRTASGPPIQTGPVNDIGQWLGQTFKVGSSKLLPCIGLMLLGILPAVLFYATLFLAFSNVSIDGAGGLRGVSVAALAVSAVLMIVWLLSTGATALAMNHLLYESHLGMQTSIGRSVRAGVRGLGRFIWAYLTVFVYFAVAGTIIAGLTFAFGLVSETLSGAFFVLAYVGFLALTVWLSVKLVFLVVAAAVAPDGSRPLMVSVDTTSGHFWAVLGRILLLALVMMAGFIPILLVFGVIVGALTSVLSGDPDGVSAGGVLFIIGGGFLLYIVTILALQVFTQSGIARLYVDLGGPSRQLESSSA